MKGKRQREERERENEQVSKPIKPNRKLMRFITVKEHYASSLKLWTFLLIILNEHLNKAETQRNFGINFNGETETEKKRKQKKTKIKTRTPNVKVNRCILCYIWIVYFAHRISPIVLNTFLICFVFCCFRAFSLFPLRNVNLVLKMGFSM